MRPIVQVWAGRDTHYCPLIGHCSKYWPLIGSGLSASSGQEYSGLSVASSPWSPPTGGNIQWEDRGDEDNQCVPPHIHIPQNSGVCCMRCAGYRAWWPGSSETKCVSQYSCLQAGHDSLSYNTSPLIILMIHITPGPDTTLMPTSRNISLEHLPWEFGFLPRLQGERVRIPRIYPDCFDIWVSPLTSSKKIGWPLKLNSWDMSACSTRRQMLEKLIF